MLRYKYNPTWRYVDIYCGDTKIGTVNYVNNENDAYEIAKSVFQDYLKSRPE